MTSERRGERHKAGFLVYITCVVQKRKKDLPRLIPKIYQNLTRWGLGVVGPPHMRYTQLYARSLDFLL